MKELFLAAAFLLVLPAAAAAQNAAPAYRGQFYVLGGFGTGFGEPQHPLAEQFAFGGEGFIHKGFGVGAEAAYTHFNPYSWLGRSSWTGSVDFSYHFRRHAPKGGFDPFILGGASILGPTHAEGGTGQVGGNLGGGANWWFSKNAALRMEIRDQVGGDFYIPGRGVFANLSFRVGLTFR